MAREKVSRERDTDKEISRRRKRKTNKICKEVMINILKKCFFFFRFYWDLFIDYLFSLYWNDTRQAIPDLDKKHAFLCDSAVTLADKIKKKELKSEELITACIERIKLVNPILNAVTDERFEEALEEAREVDKLIEAGLSEEDIKKKPFLGVPFTAKESHAVKGMLHTLGIIARRNARAEVDAECVRLLRQAGAIPIAVTNVPEINKWQETRNNVFGQTNNPYHSGHTVGGSSGGESSLAASLACPISLCSDIGGSTRMPAYYSGLYALNPTAGHTSLKGSTLRKGGVPSIASIGFLSKHCSDLIPLTKIVAGEKAHHLDLDRPVNVKDLKFYYVESINDLRVSPISSDVKNAMNKVIRKLTEQADSTDKVPKPYYNEGFNNSLVLWRHAMTKEADCFSELLTNNQGKANCWVELAKKLVGASEYTLAAIFMLMNEQVLPPVPVAWAEETTKKLSDDLIELLGTDGVLLFPSAPSAAPAHYALYLRPFHFSYWAIFNALQFPAAQVPLGLNSRGLPLGLQVVAAPRQDALCVAAAGHIGQLCGGFVPPCKVPE